MNKYYLDEVTTIYSGATPLTKEISFYDGGDITWITPKDLSGYAHKYIYRGRRNITEKGKNSCSTVLLPKGSVLFSSRAPIGYVAIAGTALCTNQGFKSFVCNEKYIDNHYLYYYLIRNKDSIAALGNGSTFKEISLKTISKIQIELPSVDEQINIVTDLVILEEKYDSNVEIMKSLEESIERIYSRCFENNQMKYEDVALANAVEIVTGGTPSTKNEMYWSNAVYDWYTPTDITTLNGMVAVESSKGISVSGLINSGAKLVPENTILMTSRATIGEIGIVEHECTTNQGILSLIANTNIISVLQLYFWIKNNKELISSIANGSTFKEIYKKNFERLKINTSSEMKKVFLNETGKLFEYYKSLNKENKIISDLKQRLLLEKF